MDKRIVSILLAIVMIFGSVASLAVPGDIIHTELRKIYRKDNSNEQEELVNDILNGFAVDKFYREVADGKFVNIKAEEDAQFDALEKIVRDNGLKTAEEIREYITNHKDEVDSALNKAKEKVIPESIDTEGFQGATNAPLLTEKNFSTPEHGYKEGTTKITTLNLPNNASSWRIQVLDNPVEPMRKDTILEGATGYIKGRDIEIGKDKFLVLYAVDSNNRIKAYVNIKITDEMIKQPREEALKLEAGNIEAGSSYAGTVVISNLGEIPEGASKWQVIVSNTNIDKIYKGDKLSGAIDYILNKEITVADENELVNMNNSFKKYVILLAVDNNGNAVGYNIFEVGSDDISKAPTLLVENTNYIGPVPGSEDGTTLFSYLDKGTMPDDNMNNVTKWQTKIYDEKPQIPILNSVIDTANEYNAEENLSINIGQYLLLLATDNDGKIKGYKIFKMEENQVKGKTATEITDENVKLEKGSIEGTTRVIGLNLTNINSATKWMYVIGKDLSAPMLDKLVDGSVNYTPENDIKVAIDDNLMILATDDDGKVKAYIKFELTSESIKDPAPILLKANVDFTSPIKGSTKGTTKIETLIPTIEGINHWRYKIDTKPFDIPEIDKMVDGSEELIAGKNIGKDLTGNEYILILATVKDTENKYATKGYATFQLNESQVYMGEATNLILDNGECKDNISPPEPGSIENTTKIGKLNALGLPGVDTNTEWRYKVLQEKIETPIEFNSKIDRTTKYNVGNNIRVNVGEYLLIVATDRFGNVKAYAQFKIEAKNVRSPNAPLLIGGTNYKIQGPEPGSMENSTKFSYLDFSTNVVGATKWMYGIGDKSFGAIEYDSVLKEAKEYTVTDNIGKDIENVSEGKYLLLLATDNDNKVKAYKEFRLTLDQIKGTKAKKLASDTNYIIEKGDKPGTTKFSKLDPIGAAGVSNWKYKLIETVEEKDQIEKEIYINYIVKDTIGYTSGRDIPVKEINTNEPKYGYMLLLATDNNSRTKGYAIIDVKSDVVKEHAERLDVKLVKGTKVDTVKFVKEDGSELPTTNKYKKLVTNTIHPTPAKGEILNTGDEYTGGDISVFVGEYVTIFELNDNNEILKFNSMEVTKDDINSVEAILTGDSTGSNTLTIPEDRINSGGQKITITLDDGATWEDLKKDKAKRDALYNSFRPSNQSTEWTKVVTKLIDDGGTLTIDDETLSFYLPMTEKYDISEDQEITLTIPATCVTGARNNIDVKGNIIIKPIVEATIKGDVVSSIVRQKDLKAGGKSIIIELGDGEWIGDIANSEDNRKALFDCFKVIGEDGKVVTTTTEWSKIVGELKSSSEPNTIIRNSSKMVTITLPEVDVDLGTSYETIKLIIPKNENLVIGATSDIVAIPTFKIYPDILKVEGNVIDEKNTVTMMAPDYRIVETDNDTWIIYVITGTLKDVIDNSDVVITGLPRGLKSEVSKLVGENKIEIKISDTASSALTNNTEVKVKIKGTAVTEPNSIDSNDIACKLVKGESTIEDLKKVEIDVVGKKLINTSNKMEYSLDSTNGSNGNWHNCGKDTETIIYEEFGPNRVYVRDKNNHRVFHLVATLNYPKAPTGVSISDVNYIDDGMKVKIGIQEPATDGYEVSTDGGKNWGKLDLADWIPLNKDFDLRIRYSANELSLHSLDTKINILDLRKVDIDVAKGIITNTSTAMEYSLNGATFYSARANETPVKFEKGSNVVIREKANRINKRKVMVVGIETGPTNPNFNISNGTISATSPVGGFIQYRIGNDPWKDTPPSGEKIDFKPGKVQIRTKATQYNIASEPVDVGTIKEPTSKPELRVDDYKKDISYWNGNNFVELENADTLQYKINDGDWKLNTEWNTDKETDLIKNTNANVSVRTKATENTLPSQIAVVNFTGNLTFENVKLNVVEGKIEGTTTAMEYSTNSTDGKNGTWIDANSGSTSVDFAKDMKVYIREKSKPLNFTFVGEVGIEANIVDNTVDYDILSGTITNKATQIIEYKFDGDKLWNIVDRAKSGTEPNTIYGIDFKPGKLQFRARGTETTLPSDIITVDIKAKASAPELRYDDVNYKIEKVGTAEGEDYEYSINGGTWINGTVDTQFEGGDIVRVRIIADNHTLPSQEQTIKFTPNLDLNNVLINVGESKLVNTSSLMEYSTNSTNGEDGTWVSCSGTETILKLKVGNTVHIREIKKPRNVRQVTTEKIKKKVFEDGTTFIKDNIDYNILQGTISIKTSDAITHQKIVNDLQYKINNSNWVNIDYVVLEDNKSKILAYNVNFVPGVLEFRLRGDKNTLPSDGFLKDTIKAPASAPNVSVGFDSTNYRNQVNVTTGVDLTTLEYSLTGDSGPWIDGEHLSTEDLVGEVYIRTKATKDALPSLAKKLTFTPVLNLKTINLSTHVQPLELNGTTTQMEYGIWLGDNSNNYLYDGKWFGCNDGNTELQNWLKEENIYKIEIRDKNQHENQYTVYEKK